MLLFANAPLETGGAVLLLVLGLIIFVVERFVRRLRRMHKVRAKVTSFKVHRVGDRNGSFPVFEVMNGPFKGETGESNMSFGFIVFNIGDEVDAFYSPEKGRILSRKGLRWMLVFFGFFTLIALIFASVIGLAQLLDWIAS